MAKKILNKEQELFLLKAYKLSGDTSALDTLVEFNQLNIKMILGRLFIHPHHPLYKDMVQEANVAMLKAIRKFDLDSGNRFISLANTIIINHIRNKIPFVNNNIRLPNNKIQKFNKIAREGITKPNLDIGISEETLRLYNQYNFTTYDLEIFCNNQYENEQFAELDNQILDFENGTIEQLVDELLESLSPVERLVYELKFGLNGLPRLSHKEISDILPEGTVRRENPDKQYYDKTTGDMVVARIKRKLLRYIEKNNIKSPFEPDDDESI